MPWPWARSSPPLPVSVFEAAKAVNGGRGGLFLRQLPGDVMNFNLAAELCKEEGIPVEQVIATDDVGSGPKERLLTEGGRGRVLRLKLAGAKAEAGGTLAECKAVAEKVNRNTRTLGWPSRPARSCQRTPTFTLAEDEMEYAVGHHGEPGTTKIKMTTADAITEDAGEVIQDLPFEQETRWRS
jgi:dihydroxyacetone kinase-like protein